MQGAGCRVQGSGCRVQGAGCRVTITSPPRSASVSDRDGSSTELILSSTESCHIENLIDEGCVVEAHRGGPRYQTDAVRNVFHIFHVPFLVQNVDG